MQQKTTCTEYRKSTNKFHHFLPANTTESEDSKS